jgi:hypothetical protein
LPPQVDFDLIPDERGLFVDVKYPDEEKPRYTIDLITMICTCMGNTMNMKCKHLEEIDFRIHNATARFWRELKVDLEKN